MKNPTLIAATLIASFASALAATPATDVDVALKNWLGPSPGGIAAAMINTDGVTFHQAGRFDGADSPAITADTQFEIGSVSKVFTALLLADAVKAGKLSLDATVGPPFAPSKVTYLQLATHTSGLPRMPADFPSTDPMNPYATVDLAMLVKSFDRVSASLAPAPSSYSNFGFAVLGQAVAKTWNQSYAEALRARVLTPLDLHGTLSSWREADRARLAPGHDPAGALVQWDLNAFAPAGAIVSDTRDLAKFVQACLGLTTTPLSDALVDTMKPRVPGETPARQLGLAWQIEKRGNATVVWHNGATGGYHAFVAFDLAAKIGVVLLTNCTRGLENAGFLLLSGRVQPAQQPSVAPAASLQEYLGDYPLAPSFVMSVTAARGQLFVQATNQPRLKLTPSGADRFAVTGVEAEVSFERDSAGKISALVLHQNGMDQRAPLGALPPKPKLPAEIELPAADLAAYVGHYILGPVQFTVTQNGAKLLVRLTGQAVAQVHASAKDEFFYKAVNAQLSFVRGADGKVEALILHQNGRDQRAAKVD